MGKVALDSSSNGGEKWITHYSSSQRILLVGEGDFSFSACLTRVFGSAHNMVATSLDSEDTLESKHRSSVAHLEKLKASGCLVLHGVDVKDMQEHDILKSMKFDRIVFNFPHAGHDPSYCERDRELIKRHKELMTGFFSSAKEMLIEDGEVHVSHRHYYPYFRWKLKRLAKKAGLILIDMVKFKKADYPGYNNKRGGEIRSDETFRLKGCFTFKFSLSSCLKVNTVSMKNSNDDLVSVSDEGQGVHSDVEYIAEQFLKSIEHPKTLRRSQKRRAA